MLTVTPVSPRMHNKKEESNCQLYHIDDLVEKESECDVGGEGVVMCRSNILLVRPIRHQERPIQSIFDTVAI
jgi:hypothetical protein